MALRTLYDLEAKERDAHAAEKGGWNDFPPNWREITEQEFAQSAYFLYDPVLLEHRQMLDRSNPQAPAQSALLQWQHTGDGFAVVNDFRAKKVRFYAFGCDHTWAPASNATLAKHGIRLFAHQHVAECSKCGALWQTD
jgi:hypothetical protein